MRKFPNSIQKKAPIYLLSRIFCQKVHVWEIPVMRRSAVMWTLWPKRSAVTWSQGRRFHEKKWRDVFVGRRRRKSAVTWTSWPRSIFVWNVNFMAKGKIGFNVKSRQRPANKMERSCCWLAGEWIWQCLWTIFRRLQIKLKISLFDIEIELISRSLKCRKICAMVYFWNFSK